MKTLARPTQEPNLAEPFSSISALQTAHLEMLQRINEIEADQSGGRRDVTLLRRDMRSLQRTIAATGAIIEKGEDRELVQSILDFWSIREAYIIRLCDQLREAVDAPPANGRRLLRKTPDLPDPIPLAPFDESSAPELDDKLRPFVGLSAFSEQDASRSIFYGRDSAIEEMLPLISANRLVVVSGPSGSGKSSLVMAGLVPALRRGGCPGSEDWKIWGAVQPGPDPVAALLQVVRPRDCDLQQWISDFRPVLEQNPQAFEAVVNETGFGGVQSLIIIDQAEELVSMSIDDNAQQAFIAALLSVTQASANIRVILIVREDFVQRLAELPGFLKIPEVFESRYRPPPLNSSELRAAILGPAQAVGLVFEPGVVEDLVREVVSEPAALPLLQFTLSQLWRLRRRNKVTRADFAKVGGPNQALGGTAERIYAALPFENQETIRAIFMALVIPSLGEEYVRRRIRREALHLLRDSGRVDRMLATFVEAGLIRLTPGVTPDDDRFEVMHEALLRNWPRLSEWLENVRRADQRRIFFLNLAQRWVESGRKRDHLAVGEALSEARPYASRDPLIGELVKASDVADVRYRRQQKASLFKARLVATCFALLALVLAFSLYRLEDTTGELRLASRELLKSNEKLAFDKRRADIAFNYLAGAYCVSADKHGGDRCIDDVLGQATLYSDFASNNLSRLKQSSKSGSTDPMFPTRR